MRLESLFARLESLFARLESLFARLASLVARLPIERLRNPPPVVAVLRLAGVVGRIGPVRAGLTLAGLAGAIERAFRMRNLKAVALTVNSPGGSAVQSALIHRRVRALAEEKEVPVFAFTEDVAASGGYWLACAGDEIFADENSIIGSIGVVYQGFGFTELMKRLGIKRRLYAAGERKGMLDPFIAEDPEDVDRLRAIQGEVHQSFKELVRGRRQGKLKASEEELFSGEFWTGKRALELGLIDGIGDLRTVMRQRFGERVRLRPVRVERVWPRRRLGLRSSEAAPAEWAWNLIAAIEERVMWARYGF